MQATGCSQRHFHGVVEQVVCHLRHQSNDKPYFGRQLVTNFLP